MLVEAAIKFNNVCTAFVLVQQGEDGDTLNGTRLGVVSGARVRGHSHCPLYTTHKLQRLCHGDACVLHYHGRLVIRLQDTNQGQNKLPVSPLDGSPLMRGRSVLQPRKTDQPWQEGKTP